MNILDSILDDSLGGPQGLIMLEDKANTQELFLNKDPPPLYLTPLPLLHAVLIEIVKL